jgi:hypothetical protein
MLEQAHRKVGDLGDSHRMWFGNGVPPLIAK